jgi:tetratricopeptide (TPR) repeat protein
MKQKKSRRVAVAESTEAAPRTVSDAPDLRRHLLSALALGLLTLVAFSNAFSTGFALDNHLLLTDTRIQAATASNVALIFRHSYWWPNGESGLYRPLTTLSYLFNYAILGNADHPGGYHWINFALHLTNVFLLYALLARLTGALRMAFFVALLWAVHPVLTESVTNIVGRADLLAALAVLSGFFLYLKSAETSGVRRAAWLGGLAVVTTLGVFSKESAVVLPAVIVIYELACGKRWSRMLDGVAATLVPIGIMLWERSVVLSSALPAEYPFLDNPIAGAGFWVGKLTAVKVLARYLGLAIWPVRLSSDYSYSEIPLIRGSLGDWISWLAVGGALAITAILWKRSRLAFFFAGFAFLNLLPASNLLFPIGTIMAERLLYLPLAGLMAAMVLAIDIRSRAFSIGVAVIATAFAIRTWMRNSDWTDDKTMAMASVQTSPDSFKVHQLLAAVLLSDHDIDGAVAEADRSVAILAPVPDALNSPRTWNLAAMCHRAKGDYGETVRLASRAVAIDAASRAEYDRRHGIQSPVPASSADGYRTLASAYLHLGQAPQALAAGLQAQTIDPSNSGAYEEIADAYVALGKGEEGAIALAEGMLLANDRELLDQLLKLYQSGVDQKGCAVKAGPHGPTLNPACEIVMRDLCQATRRMHRPDLAARFGCPRL